MKEKSLIFAAKNIDKSMDVALNNSYIWNLLSGLNVDQKLDLITKLSRSVAASISSPGHAPASNPLSSSFGAWANTASQYSTDDLIRDIEEMMTDKEDFYGQIVNDEGDED